MKYYINNQRVPQRLINKYNDILLFVNLLTDPINEQRYVIGRIDETEKKIYNRLSKELIFLKYKMPSEYKCKSKLIEILPEKNYYYSTNYKLKLIYLMTDKDYYNLPKEITINKKRFFKCKNCSPELKHSKDKTLKEYTLIEI